MFGVSELPWVVPGREATTEQHRSTQKCLPLDTVTDSEPARLKYQWYLDYSRAALLTVLCAAV